MCILKIYSDTNSFKKFAETTELTVVNVPDRGEYRNKNKTRQSKSYSISFDISDKEWDEFTAQVRDAIDFLKENFTELKQLLSNHEIKDAFLDFPLYSRLSNEIVNQNDHLPTELVSLAGSLNLGIEMSIYSKNI